MYSSHLYTSHIRLIKSHHALPNFSGYLFVDTFIHTCAIAILYAQKLTIKFTFNLVINFLFKLELVNVYDGKVIIKHASGMTTLYLSILAWMLRRSTAKPNCRSRFGLPYNIHWCFVLTIASTLKIHTFTAETGPCTTIPEI